jgi:hypothetical protein
MALHDPNSVSFGVPAAPFLHSQAGSYAPAPSVSAPLLNRLGRGPTEKQRAALVKLGVYTHETAIPATLSVAEASEAIKQAIEEGRGKREADRLSLATIQAHDPNGGRGAADGKHFLCPLPACAGHQNPKKHRSLSVAESGVYLCHRCEAKGKLTESQALQVEHRPAKRLKPIKAVMSAELNAKIEQYRHELGELTASIANHIFTNIETRFETQIPRLPEPPNTESAAKLQKLLEGCVPILDTPGAVYLERRGIPAEVAHEAGVLYHSAWHGCPSVVFLARDSEGVTVGAQGRAITGDAKITVGSTSRAGGVFATRGAGESPMIAITEAPIDALSILVATGTPAIALFGKFPPSDLGLRCRNKNILIATDSDDDGNKCSDRLQAELRFCAGIKRVEWPEGVKDANEMLLREREAFTGSQAAE